MPIADQRTVVGKPCTARLAWADAELTAPATGAVVTVTVTDITGHPVLTAATASHDTDGATVTIPTDGTTQPDILTCAWAIDGTGVAITTIDVCLHRLFSLAFAKRLKGLDVRSDSDLERVRLEAEDELEEACGAAFTTRAAVFTFLRPPYDPTLPGHRRFGLIDLPDAYVTRIRAVTVAGVPVTGDDFTALQIDAGGIVDITNCAPIQAAAPGAVVTICYEHGNPNRAAARPCAILARHRLLKGPIDDRAISLPVEGGGSISLLTPGIKGIVFGLPEVDVFVQVNGERVPHVA